MRRHRHQFHRQPAEPDCEHLQAERDGGSDRPAADARRDHVCTTAPSSVSASPAASSGTSLTWLWVLLGVLVLVVLVV
jgi:hypothetical protein